MRAFRSAMPRIQFTHTFESGDNGQAYTQGGTTIYITNWFRNNKRYDLLMYATAHEVGHVLDSNLSWQGSIGLLSATESRCLYIFQVCLTGYHVGGQTTSYAAKS